MIRPNEPDKNYTGNDQFIGFCVDLTKKIAELVNFTYEFKLVKDGRFGSKGKLELNAARFFFNTGNIISLYILRFQMQMVIGMALWVS
jgi:hypothetical protein